MLGLTPSPTKAYLSLHFTFVNISDAGVAHARILTQLNM